MKLLRTTGPDLILVGGLVSRLNVPMEVDDALGEALLAKKSVTFVAGEDLPVQSTPQDEEAPQ